MGLAFLPSCPEAHAGWLCTARVIPRHSGSLVGVTPSAGRANWEGTHRACRESQAGHHYEPQALGVTLEKHPHVFILTDEIYDEIHFGDGR